MNNQSVGKLVVIAAPSGAGKTSLVRALVAADTNIEVAVSHTTRQKRPHEIDELDYYFISRDEFKHLQATGGFIESAEVYGNLYGTSTAEMERVTSNGKHLVLEIDWQGAAQVRAKLPETISIFILPPSLKVLLQRLQTRAQDDEQTINRRMNEAINEISQFRDFKYLVVNDVFDTALNQIQSIIHTGRGEFLLENQLKTQKSLLSELLSSSP